MTAARRKTLHTVTDIFRLASGVRMGGYNISIRTRSYGDIFAASTVSAEATEVTENDWDKSLNREKEQSPQERH